MVKKIIYTIFAIGVILIMVLFIKEVIENKPEAILNKLIETESLEEGQELGFLVKYMWIIPVGSLKIEAKEPINYRTRWVDHLVAEAKTLPPVSEFFKAYFSAESYMDREKLHSLRYKEETYMPDHEPEIKDITYDQKNLVMELDGVKRKILPDTQDPLSAIFYIRSQEFEPGETIALNIITKEENYELKLEVLRKEVVKVSGCEFAVWVLDSSVRRWDRSSHHGVTFRIWLAGEDKLPILIKAKTKVGPITARLVGILE